MKTYTIEITEGQDESKEEVETEIKDIILTKEYKRNLQLIDKYFSNILSKKVDKSTSEIYNDILNLLLISRT